MKYFTIVIIAMMLLLALPKKIDSPSDPRVAGTTTIVATTGGRQVTFYGYTSPKAIVELLFQNNSLKAFADSSGFFNFSGVMLPYLAQELCLQNQDSVGRVSQPLCLPSINTTSESKVGPIILPPTVSLSRGQAPVGGTINLLGQTTPNTNVTISLFSDTNTNSPPLALPKINVVSDNLGNFSLSLPTSKPQRLRIFAQTNFNAFYSGQSNVLTADIVPWWMSILLFIKSIFDPLLRHSLTISIILELAAIAYLLNKKFHFGGKKKIREHSIR